MNDGCADNLRVIYYKYSQSSIKTMFDLIAMQLNIQFVSFFELPFQNAPILFNVGDLYFAWAYFWHWALLCEFSMEISLHL